MIETIGNLWTFPADVQVIPVNGQWRMRSGEPWAVMGAGVAKAAAAVRVDVPAMQSSRRLLPEARPEEARWRNWSA